MQKIMNLFLLAFSFDVVVWASCLIVKHVLLILSDKMFTFIHNYYYITILPIYYFIRIFTPPYNTVLEHTIGLCIHPTETYGNIGMKM